VVTVEVGHLWQARVELENALESSVLATVKQWGDQGGGAANIPAARAAGLAYASANTLHGVPVDLDDASVAFSARWHFGRAEACGTGFDFQHNPEATTELAVVLEGTAEVDRLCRPFVGSFFGEPTVTARVAASYDSSGSQDGPQLIRLD